VKRPIALATGLACLALAGCGGDDDGGEARTLEPGKAEGAKGTVAWCIGKDTTGAFTDSIEKFNRRNPDLQAKLLELPVEADQQREQQVQRLEAKSAECDVLGMDVIWTAEYAAAGWLYDLTAVVDRLKARLIPSTVETARYAGKLWAVPFNTNAGLLFYRTDQVSEAPTTWEQVYEEARRKDGLVYQGAEYEGATVNFLELFWSAGGSVLSEDGKSVELDSPEARKALQFMADGIRSGAVPKAVNTYAEENVRRAFEAGRATFMHNWPYAYTLGKKSPIADDFDVTPFPGYGGGKGTSALGGFNLAISAFTDNAEASLALVQFLTTPDIQKDLMIDATLPATAAEVYSDPDVRKAIPFAPTLLTAVEQAQPRPVSPVYPQITDAIAKNVSKAISGRASPDEAVTTMSKQIERALASF
jgi:multiple sugar transport system substrate-binding protein